MTSAIGAMATAAPTDPASAVASHALRDIHLPPAPSWWPPAPGWWVLGGSILILLVWLAARLLHRVRQRRRVKSVLDAFDRATSTTDASAALTTASEFLRRAARTHDPAAVQFEGEAWLAYLDGADAAKSFSRGDGRALIDGVFGRTADTVQATHTLRIARRRLHELLELPHA